MIPTAITRDHVMDALRQIDASSVPAPRQSMDYDLVHDGKRYPPKYVIGVAAQHASGVELPSTDFSSVESNALLTKLGFAIERRNKAPALGPDSSAEAVQSVFERLVPDEVARKLCQKIFADTIEQVHAIGAARWEITLHRNFIRLNGGRVILFDVEPRTAFVGVDPAVVDAAAKAKLDAVGEPQGPFQVLPGLACYKVPHTPLLELWPALSEGFRHFVAKATLTARQSVWARTHAPAVVEYLSAAVGRVLPQPVYGDLKRAEQVDERRVYWVNQGKSFEAERTGYLFARKKDEAGRALAHRARLANLVPGDVTVHYAGGAVRAVSRVLERATDWRRPEDSDSEGWRVNVELWELPAPVDLASMFGSDSARLAAGTDAERGPFDRSGNVKQGYLWDFTEDGLAAVRQASADKDTWPDWTRSARSRFWMFHANPGLYDVRAASRALPELTWRVRQHRSEIRVGDTVFLWEAGAQGGIVAVATVLTEPAVTPSDPADESFRKPGLETDEDQMMVRLAIERALDPIIDAGELRADPSLVSLPMFSSPQRTNSAVSPAQGTLLLSWIDGKRPPRIVKIAPGDKAEFWSECLEGGYVCVGWDEVGDLRQYTDWSAFRKGFAATCELGKVQGHVTQKAQELWTLTRLRPGDKIVANRGLSRVLGVGTVKDPGYVWNPSRRTFKHTVRVDWDETVACDIPPHKHWGLTTVDKVPPNVLALVLPELTEAGPASGALTVPPGGLSSSPPPAETPFALLVRSLQTRLWFSTEIVAHYVLALQAKRFVILTGVSGTGKTQLALAVAKHFQPRTKRVKVSPPPAGAATKRITPSVAQYHRMVLPSVIAMGLRLGGLQGTGTATIDVVYPGGTLELSCYRHVRSSSNSVHHLSVKGGLAKWIGSLSVGDEIYVELLEPGQAGRDRIRFMLPERVEEVTTAKSYEVVAVRPDWTDGRGLLGFYNPLTRRYSTTPFLRLLLEAEAEARRATEEKRTPHPYFAILDEMNLARVEQYFSDFLSALESGEPIVLHDDRQLEDGEVEDEEEDDADPVPRFLQIPRNLFFTGTVNVDETTHMFSPKVLDRAFVIEFNEVDLERYGTRDNDEDDDDASALELVGWQGFQDFLPVSADDWDALAAVAGGDVRRKLTEIHGILARDNRHFGYRVANEIGRFIRLAGEQSADPEEGVEAAFDLALISKVLPKLHGTQQELEDTLTQLFRFSVGGGPGAVDAWVPMGGQLGLKSKTEGESDECPWLPRTSLKLWRMLRRLRAQGFTSFIE
jgi:energy-coupling factor transporter ATP-binding protein EcfA2